MIEKVNLLEAVNAVKGMYQYEKIGRVNDNVMSVVQVENRKLDFHVHEKSDEMFWILEGEMTLETDEGLLPLKAGEMVVVPRGTRHRPIVTSRVKLMLMEYEGTLNKSNSVSPDEE
jgi:mannose-6-phosphate isomerase-like protein (cupin superfamily)